MQIYIEVKKTFDTVDYISELNQQRVIKSMQECRISERHFSPSTGYGYGDDGRDALDKLFALVLGGEDALVRPQWASGTHVLSDCLYALLRPGDTMLSITGTPYDTLKEVVGLEEGQTGHSGSLKEWGIKYRQIELKEDYSIDIVK